MDPYQVSGATLAQRRGSGPAAMSRALKGFSRRLEWA